jgi:hypothetical protein
MNYHLLISNYLSHFLDNVYFSNLKKLYNEDLINIFKYCKYPVFKPEYLIYLKFYFSYLFFHYITRKKFLLYSLSLHLSYTSELIFENLIKKYDYYPIYNIEFLKNTHNILFIYLLYIKIFFFNLEFYKKVILLLSYSLFYFIYNVHIIYHERLECIENKTEFKNKFKILIISPNKKFIENIVNKTKYFTYSNYLYFINFLIYIFR